MEINLTKKQQDTIFIIMIFLVCLFMIFTIYYLINNKEAFTSNPFTYGVEKMNLGQCYMSCYPEGSFTPINFLINSSYLSQILNEPVTELFTLP